MTRIRDLVPFEGAIVEREFRFVPDDGGTELVITAQVGRPVPDPEGGPDSFCPIRVLGFPTEHVFVSGGVDSLQALVLGLGVLADYLYSTARIHAGTLTWLGSSELGLPALYSSFLQRVRAGR
ncbi:MAG TPA: hypothetical protein VGP93_18705 [Polyangiaceae bacterium]|nr:hypothetical protein [Polyangiaceae bacterium]